jgi:2-polyprenyl-6-hydroxyphenyl methylase/3-demethylubiquinone-9 3-methyltransferase
MTEHPHSPSVDPSQVAAFAAMAEEWWRADGKFRPLHRLNPTRLTYLRDSLTAHFSRDPAGRAPLSGLRIVDIGCGGGLVTEPLARLGAEMTGIDAAERNIGVACTHAEAMGLGIDYRCTSAEALVAAGETFDAVLALEVVEHVADVDAFVAACGALVRPGGLLVAATLNRTLRSFATAIVGAEYLLRWLPPGTHDWKRFLRPHELARSFRRTGLHVTDIRGMSYDPIGDRWRLGADLGVNYLIRARKP